MSKQTRREFVKTGAGVLAAVHARLTGEGKRPHPMSHDPADLAQGAMRLWYRQPAAAPGEREAGYPLRMRRREQTASGWRSGNNSRAWVQALPVGNGRLGGMVFGGVTQERIQLNEESLWSGGPQDADNPEALSHLPEIRRLLFEGKYAEAQKLTYEHLVCRGVGSGQGNGARVPYGSYQTLGDMRLTFDAHAGANEYYRELDLETAIARVRYRLGDVQFTREVFASAPGQVLVVRLTCDRPRQLSFRVTLDREESATTTAVPPCSRGNRARAQVVMSGQLLDGKGGLGMKFIARLRVLNEGGKLCTTGGAVRVEEADAVTLLLTAATDYRGRAHETISAEQLHAAARQRYEALREAHVRDYQRLFHRVHLDLGRTEASHLSTDERLEALRKGGDDPHLLALYFQYGRYLLISSSRPGDLPANLQGIWAESIQTPWNGDYHHNISQPPPPLKGRGLKTSEGQSGQSRETS